MTWKGNDPAIEFTNIDELRSYIRGLNYSSWRPSNFVIHNTASPTLYQWWHSVPPAQRMENLQHYYEYDQGWSAGPHFFIDGKSWWCMTPPNVKGVHSPSWNGTMLGFEHVGDYDSESATSGMGADVQRMGHELSAICCEFFGWNPELLKFHYEDPNTSHACPGSNMVKSTYIDCVQQVMGEGGGDTDTPQEPRPGTVANLAAGDKLNIRASASSSSPIIGTAENGDVLTVIGEAWNGSTHWLRFRVGEDEGPAVAVYGWCSADYVEVEASPEPEKPPEPSRLDITTTHTGNMIISLNEKELVVGEPQAVPNIVRMTLSTEGDVVVTINGQDWHGYGGTPPNPSQPPAGPTDVPLEDRPTISKGDEGKDVSDMQTLIPGFSGEIDGDFGSVTETELMQYQATRGLAADGICGPLTWEALYEARPPLPPPPHALSDQEIDDICTIAISSWIATYAWKDRGVAPPGYTQGMALAFAQTYKKLKQGHPAAVDMAKARKTSDKDALHVYWEQFEALGMSNETAGTDTLRHLYALMLGHGMRESSGRHCEGRDQSATNTSSDTAEAGLFQTSYNAHSASDPEFDALMSEYSNPANAATCYLTQFADGVSCSSGEWGCYGSGSGYAFQNLCKECPAFAVETCGLTLRNLCNHYGPIIRKETELKDGADDMFRQVQDYLDNVEVA